MSGIDSTAVIAEGARLGEGVELGPYCVIGPQVTLGDRVRVMAHTVIDGHTRVGADCVFFPFGAIGGRSQDLKWRGGDTFVEIGERTVVREFVTINAATAEGDVTRVGADCLIMAYAHVAHDCCLGNGVILANCGTLAGHVSIGDQAIVGGLSGIHQFVRVGRLAMIGGCSKVTQDIPPFMMADGHPLAVHGPNRIGLQRRGVEDSTRRLIKEAFRILYRRNLTMAEALETMTRELPPTPEIDELAAFVRQSERGIAK